MVCGWGAGLPTHRQAVLATASFHDTDPLMITILFDIDGTLIQTGGAGFAAIRQACQSLFGEPVSVPKVPVHGRTDQGILTDVFASLERDYAQHRDAFHEHYWARLPEALGQRQGQVLPGVLPLLETLHSRQDVALGLLTGNGQRAAEIKLDHFGLSDFFGFGGFGDHHADRSDVAKLAREAAAHHLGDAFREDRLWVVGDTVADIRCARAIDARVVAVETGGAGSETLRQSQPDAQVATLAEQATFLRHVCDRDQPAR